MSRFNKNYLNGFIVIFSCVVSVYVFDSIVGVLYDFPVVKRHVILKELSPLLDESVRPNLQHLRRGSLEDKRFSLRTDHDGFILGPDEEREKDSVVDVLFLGGSTTESIYVDAGKRFPFLVSTYLDGPNGRGVKTLNGGFSGNHALHSLINFVAKGIPINPAMFVIRSN